VEEQPLARSMEEHLLQHISDNVKEKAGEWVPLAETTTTLNPTTRNPIEKNQFGLLNLGS
jgi:hypothetical protein